MKIAVAGKGGSGKTTITATLARLFARRGHKVLAIDGDSNPNLAISLGVPREAALSMPSVPRTLLEDRVAKDGSKSTGLSITPAEVVTRYGIKAPDGVDLLVMGRVAHAGAG